MEKDDRESRSIVSPILFSGFFFFIWEVSQVKLLFIYFLIEVTITVPIGKYRVIQNSLMVPSFYCPVGHTYLLVIPTVT